MPAATTPMERARRVPRELIVVIGLTLVAFTAGAVVAMNDGGPTVFGDETIYLRNAESLAGLDHYSTSHYPPAYSALIGAGLFFDDWYRAMLLLNSLASASAVPIMWSLARTIGIRRPWIPTALVALLPFQAVFAGFVLAENLAIPLTLASVTLAVRARRREAPLFGLTLAALHLTKYLFAPAVGLLVVVWFLRLRAEERDRGARTAWRTVATGLIAYALPMAAWLAYGSSSGHPLPRLLGLHVAERTLSRGTSEGTVDAFLTWLTIYPSYALLASLIGWVLAAVWLVNSRVRPTLTGKPGARTAFVLVVTLLAVGYIALGVEHSLGAGYNFPVPRLPQTRYLAHLAPLVVALGALAIDRLTDGRVIRPARTAITTAAVLGGGWFAWSVLYDGAVWGFAAWSLKLSFNAVDTFAVATPTMRAATGAGVVAMVLLLSLRRDWVVALPWLALSLAGLVLAIDAVTAKAPVAGLRHRAVAEYLSDLDAAASPATVTLRVPEGVIGLSALVNAAAFWDSDLTDRVFGDQMTTDETSAVVECVVDPASIAVAGADVELLVTNSETGRAPAHESGEGVERILVYVLDPECTSDLLVDRRLSTPAKF